MSKAVAIAIFVATIIISALLQIPLKKSATNPKHKGLRAYLNLPVIGAYASMFAITFVTTYVFRYIDLTLSTLLYKTEYIFIGIFSVLILKEKLTKRKIIGFIVIIAGVLVYTLFA